MRRRANLGHREAVAGHVLERSKPCVPCLVGREECLVVIAPNLARAAADNAQRAIAGEPKKAAREAGVSKVDSARRYCDGDGLCRCEEDQLILEAFRGEITLCVGDKDRPRRRRFENADLDVLSSLRGSSEHEAGKEKQNSHSITYPT